MNATSSTQSACNGPVERDIAHEAQGATARRSSVIELRGIEKTYGEGSTRVRALEGIDLRFHRGEFTAIIGSSGSGKSTLLNVLGCLDRPTAGSYLLDGLETSCLSSLELARTRNARLGFIFQSFHLLPRLSAFENILLPLTYSPVPVDDGEERVRSLLARVGLSHRSKHSPNELSGGERQRIAIARALVNEPPVLLADEPTGNLDSRTGMQIMGLLEEIAAGGTTVIMVTHDLELADRCQRIVTLKDGHIVPDVSQKLNAHIVPDGSQSLRERQEHVAS